VQRIFVGDVQGCGDELEALLLRVRADFGSEFELWLVGDLVNRGPRNLDVLRIVRELWEAGRARVVLGNHEVGLLQTALGSRELGPNDTTGDVLAASDLEDWIDWLSGLPVAIADRLGSHPFAMVHACVPAGWSLVELTAEAREIEARLAAGGAERARFLAMDRSAPEFAVFDRLLTCRSVGPKGDWSSRPPEGDRVPWHQAWRAAAPDFGVVYGHWSLQGLHVAPGLRGLDSGCVHNGRGRDTHLTAWIPDGAARDPFAIPDAGFVQIPARHVYYEPVLAG
jgi:bis(5'-nucleosyl)-tetraphosphatase (symmetrical)